MLLYQCYGRFSSNCRENVESIAVNCWVTCFSIGTKECQECSIRAVSQRGMMKKRNRWNNEEKKETQTCIYDSYIHSHHKRGNKRIMGVGNLLRVASVFESSRYESSENDINVQWESYKIVLLVLAMGKLK